MKTPLKFLLFILFSFALLANPVFSIANGKEAESSLTDDDIKVILIKESIASYSGSCPCPYSTTRNGSKCGKRSAYSKPGGASPLCYRSDVSDEAVENYRKRN